jgi:hypothetical protein
MRDQVNRYGLAAALGPLSAEMSDERRSGLLFGEYVAETWWPGWKASYPDSEKNTA